jgi:hypothetical protein
MKKIFLLLLAGVALIQAQINLNSGLTGYFPMNGNANDLSVTAINGTNNGATAITGYDGSPNAAMDFIAAQSDYVDAGNNNRGITDQMSISFWFKVSGTGNYELAEKYNWNDDAGFYLRMINGQIYFHGRDQTGVGHAPPAAPNQYNDGQWHHLVAILNVTHWMLYVDCQLIQDYVTASVNPDISVNYPLTFGRYALNNDTYLDGQLDEIRLYDRVLTDDEICYLCGNSDFSDELTGYFPLNGNANDFSTTAINGVNNGASNTTGFDGTINGAMDFIAVQSDYIDAGNNNRGITDQMSISFWFRVSGTGAYELAEKYNWNDDAGFYLRMVNGQIYFHGRDHTGVGHAPAPAANQYNDGIWHHLVAIVDITHWKLYVDCEEIQDYVTTSVSPDISVNYPLTFGRYALNNDSYLDGTLDEIRLYSRPLSNTEICNLCHNSVLMGVNPQESTTTNIKVFPNPSTGWIYVNGLEFLNDNYRIVVTNMMGQQVLTVMNQHSFDLSKLATGFYTLQVFDHLNNNIYSQKIVKQ